MPKPIALIFINRSAPSPEHALDLQRALDVADKLRLHVLRCYVAGPMRPKAFQHMMNDARSLSSVIVITSRVEDVRLDIVRQCCDVVAVDTGIVYSRQMRSPVEVPQLGVGHA
ncbi:hypothetical protein OH799_11450 [Nocardia sp. NBC_00881]|uniref:hypothetical protein n=1 Tax=Nocardia sp. NBC_00881 TaxID=2975995 RepID=UPI0038653658|nr:hypothetical protein OH799_11450 [Nocardia sp. NBC_00881]